MHEAPTMNSNGNGVQEAPATITVEALEHEVVALTARYEQARAARLECVKRKADAEAKYKDVKRTADKAKAAAKTAEAARKKAKTDTDAASAKAEEDRKVAADVERAALFDLREAEKILSIKRSSRMQRPVTS